MTARRLLPILAAAIAATLLGAIPADAGTKTTVKTTVKVFGVGNAGPDTVISIGVLDSSNPKCLANRKVKIDLIEAGGGTFAFDLARTSKRGGWAASIAGDDIPPAPYKSIRAKVAEKTVSLGKGKELVCKAGKATAPLK